MYRIVRGTLGHTVLAAAFAAASAGAACTGRDAAAAATGSSLARDSLAGSTRAPGYVVDSAIAPEEALRRFRVGLTVVTALDSASAGSRDRLVARFVNAVARRDTAALRTMSIGQAEFAYLYYPATQYVQPPYLLAPDIVWQLMQSRSESGMKRLVARVGGRTLRLDSYACEPAPALEGPNRLYQHCSIRYRPAPTDSVEHRRLFGSIMERDGRFKFVSYANDF